LGSSKTILLSPVATRLLVSQFLWFQDWGISRLFWSSEEGDENKVGSNATKPIGLTNVYVFLEKKNAPKVIESLWLISRVLKNLVLTISPTVFIVFVKKQIFHDHDATILKTFLFLISQSLSCSDYTRKFGKCIKYTEVKMQVTYKFMTTLNFLDFILRIFITFVNIFCL
jgi:hypothetical protein